MPQYAAPTIVAMTAHAMPEDRCCPDAGMDDYLAKPISGESLSDLWKVCPVTPCSPAASEERWRITTRLSEPCRSTCAGAHADALGSAALRTARTSCKLMFQRRFGYVVGVADLVPELRAAATDFTDFRHCCSLAS